MDRNGEGYIRDEDFPSPFDNIENYLLPSDTLLNGNDDLLPLGFNNIPANNVLPSEGTLTDNNDMLPSQFNTTSNDLTELTPTDKSLGALPNPLDQSLYSICNPYNANLNVVPSPLAQNLNVTSNFPEANPISKSSTNNRILLPDGLEIGPYGLTIINSMPFSSPHINPSNSIIPHIKEAQIPFSTPTINVQNQLQNWGSMNVVQSSNVSNFPSVLLGSDSSSQNFSSPMKIPVRNDSFDHISWKLLQTSQSSSSFSNYGMQIPWNPQPMLQASGSMVPQRGTEMLWKLPSTPQSWSSMSPQQGMQVPWRPSTSQPLNLADSQQVVKLKRIMAPEMLEELEKMDIKRYKR